MLNFSLCNFTDSLTILNHYKKTFIYWPSHKHGHRSNFMARHLKSGMQATLKEFAIPNKPLICAFDPFNYTTENNLHEESKKKKKLLILPEDPVI